MGFLEIIALVFFLVAFFAYINCRYLKLPSAIGLMIISIFCSLFLILLSSFGYLSSLTFWAERTLQSIDLNQVLMQGMLGSLLFAGALHLDLDRLFSFRYLILFLATLGVIVSAAFISLALFLVSQIFSFNIPYMYCLVFGILISPTDPVAVLAILRSLKVSKDLETKIVAESLFNDGVAVVLFSFVLGLVFYNREPSLATFSKLFLQEVLGGLALGGVCGYLCYRMLRQINDYVVEILLTLCLVFSGYILALKLHISAPLFAVISGLFIGNPGRKYAMSEETVKHLDMFWHLVDELMNAVLFVLLGLSILTVSFSFDLILASFILIPGVILARYLGVVIAMKLLGAHKLFSGNISGILTWGGLRGGISIALVLSLPENPWKEVILSLTYVIVVFSIVVQGLSIKRFLPKKSLA